MDAIVTDPPYELGFMGKGWDKSGVAFDPDTWRAALRVLKPGGHLLAFGGSRTYHRLASAIEDAGFEVRDQIMWLYGSGFPKSHNIGGGRGTALKPAHEPIVLARKPLVGTVASNVVQFGTGALNIDGCRVPGQAQAFGNGSAKHSNSFGGGTPATHYRGEWRPTAEGRWPANLIHDGSDEVEAAFAAFGERKSGSGNRSGKVSSQWRDELKPTTYERDYPASTGTASRFFYCAKASKRDRDDGLEGMPEVQSAVGDTRPCGDFGQRLDGRPETVRRNNHPTVKPTELMRYLCRLVTPPGGTVLDPFTGSGSTGRGAVLEGFNFIGAELSPEYADIARRRIKAAQRKAQAPLKQAA